VERLYARWQLLHPTVPPTPTVDDDAPLTPFTKPDGTFFLHREVFDLKLFKTTYDDEGTAAAPETRLQAGEVVHTFAVVVEDVPRVTPFGR
jgi:hypothetical protein